jgi:hypothetical protein
MEYKFVRNKISSRLKYYAYMNDELQKFVTGVYFQVIE